MEIINNIINKFTEKRKEIKYSTKDIALKADIDLDVINLLESQINEDDYGVWFSNVYKYANFLDVDIKEDIKSFRQQKNIATEQEIGMVLQHQRKLQDISIEEVSSKLKISKKMITRIEKGDIKDLSSFYRKNYIKRYSEILKVDISQYDDYLSQSDTIEIKTKKSYSQKPKEDKETESTNKPKNKIISKVVVTFIVIIAVILVLATMFMNKGEEIIDMPYHIQFMPSLENLVTVEEEEEKQLQITDVTDENNYEVDKTFEISNVETAKIGINFIGDCYVQSDFGEYLSSMYYNGDSIEYEINTGDDLIIQFGNINATQIYVEETQLDLSDLTGVAYIEIKLV